MDIIENYYEDLLFDLDYLEWKRDQELLAWREWVEEKEIEEQGWDKIAEQHFTELENYELLTNQI